MDFDKNLRLLRKVMPNLYNQLRDREPDNKNYKAARAKMVDVVIIEKVLNGRLTPIHSRFNPLNEAAKWAAGTVQDTKTTEIILFGLGFGYHLLELVKLYPDARFYIYEPDINVIVHSLRQIDWNIFPWGQIQDITIGEDPQNKNLFLNKLLRQIDSRWSFFALPSYQNIYKKDYVAFSEALRNSKESHLSNLKTTAAFEKKWTLNALKNLEALVNTPSIFDFKDCFNGRTVIMTASGPSLEDAIPLLNEAKATNKALIVAAGTSVKGLLNQGVQPDMFVSYDPLEINFQNLESVLSERIPLVFGSTLSYKIVEKHLGAKAHFILSQDTIYPFLNKSFDKSQLISDAPTIAAVTLHLLIKLGVKQIILAGQDLAYIGDKYYAAGTSILRSDQATKKEKEQWLEAENNIGGITYTSKSLSQMKDSIEQVVAAYPGVKIYNLSEMGAKIKGVQFITETEACEILQQQDAGDFDLKFNFDGNRMILRDYFKTLNKAVKFYSEQTNRIEDLIKQMDHAYREGKSLKLFFHAIDNLVNKMTNKNDFNYFIRPFIRTRIFFAEKNITKIRNSVDPSQDIYEEKEAELANYYLKEIGALLVELKEVINIFNNMLVND